MNDSREPTGGQEMRHDTSYLVLTREFQAPVADVWAAVTESDRLGRWIGTWTGDPATGSVDFRMTFEGDGSAVGRYDIDVCEPPHRLTLRTSFENSEWLLELDLAEADSVTTLTFAQVMADPELASSVGPGWEYYLDRLVAAETGGEVVSIVWEDYYPGQADHYRAAFG
jgi:uncharacterized protein YndB with AHSA1/START domain